MRSGLSFIVIAYKSSNTLSDCLRSIESESIREDELILVLNNPDPQTKSLAHHFYSWQILYEDKQGAQFARNKGASFATKSILCFLDSDVKITKGWTEKMLQNFDNPWVVAGQSKIQVLKVVCLKTWIKKYFYLRFNSSFYLSGGKSEKRSFISLDTASLMVRRDWFLQLHGFDTNLNRLEDTDFSLRIIETGGDIFFEDSLPAVEINDSSESVLTMIKNVYLSKKFLPYLLKKHYVPYYFPFCVSLLKRPELFSKFLPKICFLIEFIDYFIELLGVITSSFSVNVLERSGFTFKGNLKRNYFTDHSNPNVIYVWVGGKKRGYNLISKFLFKVEE